MGMTANSTSLGTLSDSMGSLESTSSLKAAAVEYELSNDCAIQAALGSANRPNVIKEFVTSAASNRESIDKTFKEANAPFAPITRLPKNFTRFVTR